MENALGPGNLDSIASLPVPRDLLNKLRGHLETLLPLTPEPKEVLARLGRYVEAARSPTSLLAFFDRDVTSLESLLKLLGAGDRLADRLIADPESFDLALVSGGAPAPREVLVDEMVAEMEALARCGGDLSALAELIRAVVGRERLRIAYAEFVAGAPPQQVVSELTVLAEAVIESALHFSAARMATRYGIPRTPDGSPGRIVAIGLGRLGSGELSYGCPLELMFLCDLCGPSDGAENLSGDEYFAALVREVVAIVAAHSGPGTEQATGTGLAFAVEGPLFDVSLAKRPLGDAGPPVCTVTEAERHYQSVGRTWERLLHSHSRVVAGNRELGEQFLGRIEPWVYRRFGESADREGLQTLAGKLSRHILAASDPNPAEPKPVGAESSQRDPQTEPPTGPSVRPDRASIEVRLVAGGLNDIESVVSLLRVIHGAESTPVRSLGTLEAIEGLLAEGHISATDAASLHEAFVWLTRCEHAQEVDSGTGDSDRTVAWNLGYRDRAGLPDVTAFHAALANSLRSVRPVIAGLLERSDVLAGETPIETELLLDPEPDQELASRVLRAHGMTDPVTAMIDLQRLADEPVPYLSGRKCRHHLAAIAPTLLAEISRSPTPAATLRTLAEVSDSLGGKATLWELMGTSPAAMSLLVRLCACSPYLAGILVRNPGMIDELIDSLLLDRLPSAAWLEASSIELCRGAADIRAVMQGFKNGAHLQIGVRDLLGKESLEATHASLACTAESILRRTSEAVARELSEQYGDPVTEDGTPVELVILAVGKLGAREPNYHSDLQLCFLYTADCQTRRRVGGHRTTTTAAKFFGEVARRTIDVLRDQTGGIRLFELGMPLGIQGPAPERGPAVSVETFAAHFRHGKATLTERLAICKARAISGRPETRQAIDAQVRGLLAAGEWYKGIAQQVLDLRLAMEDSAANDNLKRAKGGTVDVELATQTLQLCHAARHPDILVPGTIEALGRIADAGLVDRDLADRLQDNYRTLREVESKLRLLDTPARHEIPTDADSLKRLAFLLDRPDADQIVATCREVRAANRELFLTVIRKLSE